MLRYLPTIHYGSYLLDQSIFDRSVHLKDSAVEPVGSDPLAEVALGDSCCYLSFGHQLSCRGPVQHLAVAVDSFRGYGIVVKS